MKLYFEV